MQRIHDLKSVKAFQIAAGDALWLGIMASGTSPSSGWRNPVLSPWLYTRKPADDIQDFDFYADEPRTVVDRSCQPIVADGLIERSRIDYWGEGNDLAGVRIHSRQDTIEARFSDAEPVDPSTLPTHVQTIGVPWSWTSGRENGHADEGQSDLETLSNNVITSIIGTRLRLLETSDACVPALPMGHTNIQIDLVTRTIKRIWVD